MNNYIITIFSITIIALLSWLFYNLYRYTYIFGYTATSDIPYNLGDFIRSRLYRERGWKNDPNYTTRFIDKYPGSIAAEYYSLNSRDRQTRVWYYDDDSINYVLLKSIVDRRAKGLKVDNNINIHLRIGDVMDNSGKDYMEYLNDQQVYINGGEYVKPLKYYKEQEKKISKMFGTDNTITIIAYNYDKDQDSNSYKYTMAIYYFFKEKGYNVEITYNIDTDAEFVSLCNSKYFVPSGGGFSLLIAKLIKK